MRRGRRVFKNFKTTPYRMCYDIEDGTMLVMVEDDAVMVEDDAREVIALDDSYVEAPAAAEKAPCSPRCWGK